ncbi:MAG: hypothetical protein MZV70_42810 [Desulfobacterales bacterium]|nr:hypothetical protein [Desulfobacterales bacterium]
MLASLAVPEGKLLTGGRRPTHRFLHLGLTPVKARTIGRGLAPGENSGRRGCVQRSEALRAARPGSTA